MKKTVVLCSNLLTKSGTRRKETNQNMNNKKMNNKKIMVTMERQDQRRLCSEEIDCALKKWLSLAVVFI
jgi:hypothetical protein